MATEFRLPELGEDVESGDIVDILVSAGDIITKDQNILEIETDKAVIEVPSSLSGKIEQIHVKEGESVEVGQLIFTIEEEGEAEEPAAPEEETEEAEVEEEGTAKAVEPGPQEEEPVTDAEEKTAVEVESGEPRTPAELPTFEHPKPSKLVPAAPGVRRLAREIGVNITEVPGTGPRGRITPEDVKKYSKQLHRERRAAAGAPVATEPLPDFSKWGEVKTEPMSNVRRKTAEHMMSSWAPVPHVTQYDKADITVLEQTRKKWAGKAEATGGKLTITSILVKVVAAALKVFPQFNTSIDMENKQVIYKKFYHIGIAVDTDRGLLVPVIRDVNKKNILELSAEVQEIAEQARNRKLGLEDLQGGCFSITNLGGIGGTNFSPIVNTPEVAILGVARASMEPVYNDGEFEPRLMLPLALSYDHRIIDGADAARFLRWICSALEDPIMLALEG